MDKTIQKYRESNRQNAVNIERLIHELYLDPEDDLLDSYLRGLFKAVEDKKAQAIQIYGEELFK